MEKIGIDMSRLVVWNDREGRRTLAVLWDGDKRYVGIALLGRKDQFNRWKGRKVAGGRAYLLREIETGRKQYRQNLHAFWFDLALDQKPIEGYKIPEWMYKYSEKSKVTVAGFGTVPTNVEVPNANNTSDGN